MEFIYDPSLALYLPLYELDGASFASKDACAHLCTVTGAPWTPQGRTFDGVDDNIRVNTSPVFEFDSAFTLEAWVNLDANPPAVHQWAVEVTNSGGTQRLGLAARRNTTGYPIGAYNSATSSWIMANSAALLGSYAHIIVVFTAGISAAFYLNGISDGAPALGAFPSWAAGATQVYVASISGGSWLKGFIGEVRIYDRALTPLEVQRNYLATKWRYQ
ncbi:MAG: LamG domain-containing protein [Chloroflexi bacterium]|nr:LamG domain-containing protein [Chloroflexota bacterium]